MSWLTKSSCVALAGMTAQACSRLWFEDFIRRNETALLILLAMLSVALFLFSLSMLTDRPEYFLNRISATWRMSRHHKK